MDIPLVVRFMIFYGNKVSQETARLIQDRVIDLSVTIPEANFFDALFHLLGPSAPMPNPMLDIDW